MFQLSYLALKTIFSCEFIAHVSSTVSVITLYWGVWVNRKFDKDNIIDWLVCVIALGIIIWGLYNIVNKIRKKYTVVLNYNLLHDFLTVARCEAENTIINIGGDLSWLECKFAPAVLNALLMLVLIETYWNVNSEAVEPVAAAYERINRNILECKFVF